MPRDAAATRDLLVTHGRELFARSGVFTTPLKQVVEAAGQRNTSALHYHFGGRDGLLAAIIDVHNASIEARRKDMLDLLGPDPSLRELVETVVLPQSVLLDDGEGRQFLTIISQLSDLFDRWDETETATPPQALRAFRAIAARLPAGLSPLVRRERITRFLELVAEALGSRARQHDSARRPTLPTAEFVANLVTMAVGALSAEEGFLGGIRPTGADRPG
jgi:AcrR family transcriptional regulator